MSFSQFEEEDVDNDDNDTIRCLIITDNHVGYLERDPVRGDDSFITFEECLQIAVSPFYSSQSSSG